MYTSTNWTLKIKINIVMDQWMRHMDGADVHITSNLWPDHSYEIKTQRKQAHPRGSKGHGDFNKITRK